MAKATLVSDRGGEKVYACQQCNKWFSLSATWHNCFYCCQDCAATKNACSGCGNNRHWACTCNHDYEY